MPRLIRLYIIQVFIGFGISAVFVALLLWLDIKGLRGLIAASDAGGLAVFMLWFMNGIVFAGVQFAYVIMSMAERKPSGPRGGHRLRLQTAPVRAQGEKRRDHQSTVRS